METIIVNEDNLKDDEITEIVQRVKVIIINSNKEILLGYSHNDYQFPGGYVEEGESFEETINREVEEETGIVLDVKKLEPFACNIGYYKDYPEKGNNRKNEIYYYEVFSDAKPNLNNTNYTEAEKEGNFELRYIPIADVRRTLEENTKQYGDRKCIAKEMLELFDIYEKLKNVI